MQFYTQLQTPGQREEIINILANANANDPLTVAVLGGCNIKRLVGIVVDYYIRHSNIFFGCEHGEMKCAILWDDNLPKPQSFADRLSKSWLFLRFLPFNTKKYRHNASILSGAHYTGDHVYIFLLASKVSGMGYGGQIMREFISRTNRTIFLHNSNVLRNDPFYRRLGLEQIGSCQIYDVAVHQYLLKK